MRDVDVRALLALLQRYSRAVAVVRVVGDDADRRRAAGLVDEPLGRLVELDLGHAQLGRAPEPRDERDDHDRGDEEGGDLDAVRPLDDVDDRRVDEDQRDQRRRPTAAPRWPAPPGRERHGDGGRGHQDQHAGGVGAALGVDVGPEDERDDEGDGREDQHQRPGGARPLRAPCRSAAGSAGRCSAGPAIAEAPANQRIRIVLTS